ncbi:hypothetical protein [Streptomyces sp. NPDC056701]|uniref:hypothetical protein n=1 Tax=Streptomyces sp. NPDC056701 TaxID=3345916 RepID=UPI00368DA670
MVRTGGSRPSVGKLTGGEGTRAGDLRGVDRQLPADGPSCFQNAGAGKEHGRVTGSGP